MKLTEITKGEFVTKLKDPGKAKVEAWIKEIRDTTPEEWVLDYDLRDPAIDFGDYELVFVYKGNDADVEYEFKEMIYAIHDVIGNGVLDIESYEDDNVIVIAVDI